MLPTGTVTFLFTDIEGSTPLWEHMPTEMHHAVAQHHAILREVIESNNGQVFQILGDAFQAAFCLATDGLNAAIQAQRELQSTKWGATGRLKVRMGLHTGPVELNPVPGPAGTHEYTACHTLNRAARVMSAGYGEQILVSQETKSLIERDLPDGVRLRDLGEHQLKGMRRLEHLYQVVVADLPQDFPAIATSISHPNNLPVEITSFVGRKKEISELKGILEDASTHLVTVIGAGGMGKTRLALKVAKGMIETYTDGVWLVELASLSEPAYVPQTVAQVLNVRQVPGRAVTKLLEEHLSTKRLLLILDNCEHLRGAAMQLASQLLRTCPHVQIMATSRELLGVEGEIAYRCPSLLPSKTSITLPISRTASSKVIEASAAVLLFTERAELASPGFCLNEKNIATISAICQRIDGIPLAIELAAARVRVLSVDQIAARLDDTFRLLTGGSLSAMPHHRTLKALIDWSYDLLLPAEKTMLLRLSVFAGGWDLEAAEAVGTGEGIEKWQAVDLMSQLVDKSLILIETMEGGERRYQMLETIRQYAYDKLSEGDEYHSIHKRHLDYFLHMAEQAAPHIWDKGQEEWMRRGRMENDNLRGALHWSLIRAEATAEEIESGARMASALWVFWYLQSIVEGVKWLAIALERSPQPNQTRARLLAANGSIAWQLGNLPMAANRMREALDLFSVLKDPHGHAEATHMYGHIVFDQQNYTEAERVFKECLSIYESLGDNSIRIALISDLGLVAYHLGNLKLAREYQEQSLALNIENGIKDSEAQVYLRLGDIDRLEGDYENANTYYEKGLKINRGLKIPREMADSLHKLGYIAIYRGDVERAQALFIESLAMQYEASNPQGIAECLAGLASVKVMEREDEQAAIYFGAAKEILTRTGLPLGPADQAEWTRDEAVARSRCDLQRFEQAWTRGREAKVEDLLAAFQTPASHI